jgi:hypothetical protein
MHTHIHSLCPSLSLSLCLSTHPLSVRLSLLSFSLYLFLSHTHSRTDSLTHTQAAEAAQAYDNAARRFFPAAVLLSVRVKREQLEKL